MSKSYSKSITVGDHVVFFDEMRVAHDALVETWWMGQRAVGDPARVETVAEFQAIHGEKSRPSVNLVYVVSSDDRRDQYGGQKKHDGSVPHGDSQTPPRLGRYWLFADEV